MPRTNAVWLAWESHRRNREIAAYLKVPLFEWPDIDAMPKGIRKYSRGIFRTLRFVLAVRPRMVFCQNPSIVLAALLCVMKRPLGCKVVVDAHNVGISPLEGRSRTLNGLARWVQRCSDVTIVTNSGLERVVRGNGGHPLVLPDRIPNVPDAAPLDLGEGLHVVFICSFAADEPWRAVCRAAELLMPGTTLHVTGNYRKAGVDPAAWGAKVVFTGFLPEEGYWRLLKAADVVVDLTERENCLVCGAYEALAVGCPVVLSDTAALRHYFSEGAVYARHEVSALADAINDALRRRSQLRAQSAGLRDLREREWNEHAATIVNMIRGADLTT